MSKQQKRVGNIVNTLLDGVHELSRTETIVGELQKAGDATIIPVHRLRVAFAAGNGKAGAHGSTLGGDYGAYGAGGAVELDPIAAIAVGADGHAHLLTVEGDSGSTWAHLIAEVPGLITKLTRVLGERVGHEIRLRGRAELGEGDHTALPGEREKVEAEE